MEGLSMAPGVSTKLPVRTDNDPIKMSMCVNPTIEQLQAALDEKVDQCVAFLEFMRGMNPDGKTVLRLRAKDGDGTWVCTFEEDR